jgi:hypothetical protein
MQLHLHCAPCDRLKLVHIPHFPPRALLLITLLLLTLEDDGEEEKIVNYLSMQREGKL